MLEVKVTGDRIVISNLQGIAGDMPQAIQRAVSRIAKGVHREAFHWLSGAAGAPGGYPVPVRTGHLRRMLNWLQPGQSKTDTGGATFSAATNEAVVYDSAVYADWIHEGKGSSAKFGPRQFLYDALERFNVGDQAKRILEEEVQKDIDKRGMA